MLSPGEVERRTMWTDEVPRFARLEAHIRVDNHADFTCRLAFSNDALMHALLTFTASHLHHIDASDAEAAAAYKQYLTLTLREHNEEVLNFDRSKADAACIITTLLRLIACCMLQSRPINPYSPPIQ